MTWGMKKKVLFFRITPNFLGFRLKNCNRHWNTFMTIPKKVCVKVKPDFIQKRTEDAERTRVHPRKCVSVIHARRWRRERGRKRKERM
jgi:hypothetical protein